MLRAVDRKQILATVAPRVTPLGNSRRWKMFVLNDVKNRKKELNPTLNTFHFIPHRIGTYPRSVQGIVKISSLWCQQKPSSIYRFSLMRGNRT